MSAAFYLSEKFSVTGPVARREQTGRAGLQILRDNHDIPHTYGRTRDDVMFGSGWVATEDRGLLLLAAFGPAYLATLDVPGFIGSIFGNGGGNEVANSDFLARLRARLGTQAGTKVFRDLRSVNDPEAPTTISKAFAYDGVPTGPTPGATVIDPGSQSSAATAAVAATAASRRLASNFIVAGPSTRPTGIRWP